MKRMYRSVLLAVFILEALVPVALAQGQAEAQEEDGPGRGVARVSLLNGDVTVRRGDSGDWVAAAINAPLLADDRVLSGANSHTEIQLDYYNRIRLAGDTEIRFSELEWHKYQMQVPHGTVMFSALPGTDDQIEFATPAASLRPLAPGSYRMTVLDDGSVEFTVRRGEAEIFTAEGTQRLTPGRTMRLHLAADNVAEFQFTDEAPRDGFDEFSEARDEELQRVKSYQYVNRDVPGAEDLDDAGEWVNEAPYGWSWRPYVAPGWAPYREGRWVWADDDYGWTWLSYDPWGWAPYHYGRWFCAGGSWFWNPGAYWGPHYWRPGLVAFFGFGGFGAGAGFGGLGWVPLAPYETYHPWYGRRGHGGFGGNINNVNIGNAYRNARVGNGVSGVDAKDFGRGGVDHGRPLNPRDLGRTSVIRGALPVNPSRDSLRMSDRQVSGALVARAAQSRNARFVAARSAPPSNRVPFGSLNQGMRSAPRGAWNAGAFSRAGAPQGAPGRASDSGAGGNAARTTTQGGWPRIGNEAGTGSNRGSVNTGSGASQPSTNLNRGGWSAFGTPAGGRALNGDSAPAARGAAGNTTNSQRGGWTSFGSPERTNSGVGQSNRGPRSAGGSANGASGYGRSESPYRSPASSSDGWSTRGGSSPGYSAPSGGSSPRYSSPSGAAGRQSAPAPSRSGGGGGGGSRGGGGGGGSHSGGGHSSRR